MPHRRIKVISQNNNVLICSDPSPRISKGRTKSWQKKCPPPIHHQSLDLLAIDFKNSAIIITHLYVKLFFAFKNI